MNRKILWILLLLPNLSIGQNCPHILFEENTVCPYCDTAEYAEEFIRNRVLPVTSDAFVLVIKKPISRTDFRLATRNPSPFEVCHLRRSIDFIWICRLDGHCEQFARDQICDIYHSVFTGYFYWSYLDEDCQDIPPLPEENVYSEPEEYIHRLYEEDSAEECSAVQPLDEWQGAHPSNLPSPLLPEQVHQMTSCPNRKFEDNHICYFCIDLESALVFYNAYRREYPQDDDYHGIFHIQQEPEYFLSSINPFGCYSRPTVDLIWSCSSQIDGQCEVVGRNKVCEMFHDTANGRFISVPTCKSLRPPPVPRRTSSLPNR